MDFSLKNKFIYALVLLFQLHFFQSLQGQNINYVPLNTQSTLLNKTINTNLPVGATVAEARVSQYGAAKYSIPIVVPPGTNGIIPQIAVEYNSQAGNGVMGLGWNISGLSTITRSGQSIYFDGKTTAVNFSSDDRYYLDGQRLIQKSGTYGNNGSTYRTESENFASITSYCSANGKPQWFKVELKDGTVMEYGKNLNSTLYTNNYSDKMLWRLNRISYKDGNFIDFEWVTGYRDNRISEIRYTGNSITGQSPYNVVRFHYKERADKNAQYENGSNIGRYYLLDRIEVNAEQQTVKNYEFKYSFDGYRSILNSIAEKGSDGSSLNSTIFRYGDQPSNFNTVTSSVTAGTAVDLFSGDFDGDGYSDILTAPYVFNNGFRYNTDMTVYKRTATNATFSQSYSTPLPADFQIVNGINSPNMYNFMASDYTGDGRDDIMLLKMRVEGSQNWRKLKEFKLYESTGISFNTSVRYPDPNYDIIHPSGKCFYPGDFDGDGATDYITFLSNASGYRAFVSFPRRNIYNQQISGMGIGTNSATAWVVSDFIYVIDFDGDGKQELMRIKDATTEIYTFEKSGNSLNATAVYQASYPTKWHRLYFGDFNGDRKTDMLVRTSQTSNNASWEKSLSTGVNFFVQPFSFNKTPDVTGTYSDDKLVISDFNGDGLMDILHGWNNPGTVTTTSTIGMYYSRGTDFRYETNAFNSLLGYASWINSDLNGDGRSDIINRTYYGTPFDIFYFKSGGEELLMKDAVDGHLSRVIFDYQRMNETQGGFYNKGSHVGTAMNTVQLPMQLAYRLRKDNGIGSFFDTRYTYGEAKIHKEGKGFLGFRYFTEIDNTNGTRREHYNGVNDIYYLVHKFRTSHFINSTNYRFRTVSHYNGFSPTPNNGYWMRLTRRFDDQRLEGRIIQTDFTYDSYGNIKTETTDYNGVFTQTKRMTYGQFGTPVPSRPSTITVTSQRPGQPSHSTTVKLAYNIKGQVTTEAKHFGQPQQLTTTYTYHDLGTQRSATVSAQGLSPRTTTTNYDSKGRFVTETINPLNQSSTATYDIKWGQPLSTTGINGLTNTYAYDAFGRLTRTNRPEGYAIDESYNWFVNTGYGTTHYHLQAHPGRPDVKTFYDKLGRKKRVETEGFQNQWTIESWTYDSRGREKTKRAPYKAGENTFTTTHAYDAYNRVISSSNPFGTTTYGYSYNNGLMNLVVTTPDGLSATSKTDAAGLVVEASDNGGTLTHTYNSQKLQIEAKLGNTIMVSTSYDVYGRKTQMEDKNAGITTYGYNAFGEQISHTNANGHTYNMDYDKLSRTTRRYGPDEDRYFTYYGAGTPEANKVRYVINSNAFGGDAEFFNYDNFGRLDHLTTRISGTDYDTYFQHNAYGDITKKTFPSGYDLDYQHDANGYLSVIKHGTTNLFTNQSMNGRRQYTSYTLGNNKTSHTAHYYGIPTRYYTQGVQDLRMGWNVGNGNLMHRQDVVKGQFESFTYDNLNRLSTAQATGQATQSTTYQPNGNIASKTDVGSYFYNSPKVNAITRVSNSAGTIPRITQNISYTGFDQPKRIVEGNFVLDYEYGNDQQRIKSTLRQSGAVVNTRYYIGEYEKQVKNGVTQHLHYVNAGEGTVAIIERKNNVDKIYYTYTDHLGSILTATDDNGVVQAEQNFDAWGRKRNASTWAYTGITSVPDWMYRGYTAHEHLPEFRLINMNGRMYDPVVGRMLSPDNFIQSPGNTQSYNRYTYAFNNPLKYVDPSGEAAWVVPVIVGAVMGAYMGGVVANGGNYNPLQWDFSSGRTWAYMLGGAVIGGVSSGLGYAVAASGIPLAKTMGTVASSFVNSVGNAIMTNGQTTVSIKFGIASYNFSTGKFGFFGKKGNTLFDNLGYVYGGLKVATDVNKIIKKLKNLSFDKSSSMLQDGLSKDQSSLGSSGTFSGQGNGNYSSATYKGMVGGSNSNNYITTKYPVWEKTIAGFDKAKTMAYGSQLTSNVPQYGSYFSSCVSHTNALLTQSSMFNIGIHSFLLHAQASLSNGGI